jgi:hypothetical protein
MLVADVNGVAKGGGIGAFFLWKGVYLGMFRALVFLC